MPWYNFFEISNISNWTKLKSRLKKGESSHYRIKNMDNPDNGGTCRSEEKEIEALGSSKIDGYGGDRNQDTRCR